MPWAVAAAAVAAGGAIYSANKSSGAAKDAANAQTDAANSANQTQLDMFNQSRADQSPFRDAGLVGLQQYMQMLGLPSSSVSQAINGSNDTGAAVGSYGGSTTGMSGGLTAQDQAYLKANPDVASSPFAANPYQHYLQYGQSEGRAWPGSTATSSTETPAQTQQDAFAAFRATPGYQFGLDEGNKSVQASAAARGGLNSGATLKALTEFGNNYADQQGYTPYMNKLASLWGGAQSSTNTTGALGANAANQIGQNTVNAGQARAGGIYGSANAWSNGAQQIAGAAGQYFGQQGANSYIPPTGADMSVSPDLSFN